MTRKPLLTFAAAILTATIGAGAIAGLVSAQPPLDIDGVLKLLPACADGRDNDGDGYTDLADPDCGSSLGTSEGGGPPSGGGGGGSDDQGGSDGGGGGGKGGGSKGDGLAPDKGEITGPIEKFIGEGKAIARQKLKDAREQAEALAAQGGVVEAEENPLRGKDGRPTRFNPNLTIADFAAPLGVPNPVIDQFEIPPFLLPIYQACGTQYGIPWQVLASINKHETAFGTNLNVSYAGAKGWMQFIDSTWEAYGTDANRDGRKDPYNPVDAICAASRYLKAAGGDKDLPRAVFAYNHDHAYVAAVLLVAKLYGRISDDLVGALGAIAQGHFPVAADARYADDISEREALKRSRPRRHSGGNVADVIASSPTRRGINIFARRRAPVVAVNDGIVRKMGENDKLGKFLVLEDAYGNRYTYAELGSLAKVHPVLKERDLTAEDFEIVRPKADPPPDKPASDTDAKGGESGAGPLNTEDIRERLFALPQRPANVDRADLTGQLDALLDAKVPGYSSFKKYFSSVLPFDRRTMEMRPLREGSRVCGGCVLGRIGKTDPGVASHVHFEIRPAGAGRIDPKPILDGWVLQEATKIYRAAGLSPFAHNASAAQVLLASKEQLVKRALADPRLAIYSCGRDDIQSGQIDRRVLATIEYLATRGLRPTVTSLRCGHSIFTKSGSVSHHASGNAVDIAAINGISILGNQGRGSITEATIKELLQLQGGMRPAQIISLMDMGGPTFVLSDHADHIHVGFTPLYGSGKLGRGLSRVLKPDQWARLISRIGQIDMPSVPHRASKDSIPAGKRASRAHHGE
jgi:murein DD-endopeptidase MepM/ murein hydrolase activator NlpD